jgi:uncharacterized protein YndB with AHSA1/START domain
MRVTVERVVSAPPERVFALLADPSRHREIDGSGTLRGAVEGPRRLALGDVFAMDMQAGARYRMLNTVVELVPDRRIAWQARPDLAAVRGLVGGRVWRYELEPVAGGTRVRETWDTDQEQVPWLVNALAPLTRLSMTRTLDRIERLLA